MMPYSDADMAALAGAHGRRVTAMAEDVVFAEAAYHKAHKVAVEAVAGMRKAISKRDAYHRLAVDRGRKLKAQRARMNVLESENGQLRARLRGSLHRALSAAPRETTE